MNSKLPLCLVLVLGGCFCSQTVQAFWMTIPLNRANITTEAPFLRIVPTHSALTNNQMVQFSVIVLLKDKSDAEWLSGSLIVRDSQEAKQDLVETSVRADSVPEGIPLTAVPRSWAGKCKVFHFAVAEHLLANSEFSVNCGAGFATGDAYVFNLKGFADKK